jgi:class 3 adenylate cyclase
MARQRKFVTILRADLVHSTDLIAELEPNRRFASNLR